jgi:hypothetical protein
MLGYPVDPPVLAVNSTAVKIREVRAISRKDCIERCEILRDFTPDDLRCLSRLMIKSELHGDMQSATEMSAPPSEDGQ